MDQWRWCDRLTNWRLLLWIESNLFSFRLSIYSIGSVSILLFVVFFSGAGCRLLLKFFELLLSQKQRTTFVATKLVGFLNQNTAQTNVKWHTRMNKLFLYQDCRTTTSIVYENMQIM